MNHTRRRLSILDAIVLTFAAGLSIAAATQFHPYPNGRFQMSEWNDVRVLAHCTLLVFTCVLAVLVLLDGLKWRQSLRRPGRACLVALLVVIPVYASTRFSDLALAVAVESMWWKFHTVIRLAILLESHNWALPTVVATSTIMMLQRRRVHVHDWLDLAGVVVGVFWIAYIFTTEFWYWRITR